MPSTDRKLELKAKTSMAQTASQAAAYAKGLTTTLQIKTRSLSDATNLIGFSETEIYWEDDDMFWPTKPPSGRSKAPKNKW
jgi:hypothetical protein